MHDTVFIHRRLADHPDLGRGPLAAIAAAVAVALFAVAGAAPQSMDPRGDMLGNLSGTNPQDVNNRGEIVGNYVEAGGTIASGPIHGHHRRARRVLANAPDDARPPRRRAGAVAGD